MDRTFLEALEKAAMLRQAEAHESMASILQDVAAVIRESPFEHRWIAAKLTEMGLVMRMNEAGELHVEEDE